VKEFLLLNYSIVSLSGSAMSEVFALKDEKVDRQLAAVRELKFETYQQGMTKTQLIALCNEIISALLEILESYEE
jgi:hypothetical protein